MTTKSRLLTGALLLSAWGGAALLTIAVVAPVGEVLPTIFITGIMIGLAVALLSGRHGAAAGATAASLASAGACAVAQFGINPRIVRLREMAGGSIDAWSQDDPRRVMFGMLHGYSVGALAVAMLAGAVALVYLLYGVRSAGSTSPSPTAWVSQ
ncbi:MAG: hypothetical protein NTU67_00910 [Gemmatimonadetes bacterium]|nr:hypothetical protein [Gemmatimonadota bacterium]